MERIAVLMTCFNRRLHTLSSLANLKSILAEAHVYLVDDNSTDGTKRAISAEYPEVTIIHGTGDLFWNRGMNLAWEKASKNAYNFYLWLNDDVILYDDAIKELMTCSSENLHKAIISGIIENKEKNQILYGGSDKNGLIQPNGKMNPIKSLNGNVVLVPKYVFEKLGNLDPIYHHDLGDVDYGLRAQKLGIKVLTTRKPVAEGTKNNIIRVRRNGVSIKERFKNLYSPLGSPPSINFYYRKIHFGILNAIAFVIFLYIINILPDSIVHAIWGPKYK